MTRTTAVPPADTTNAFAQLDQDWVITCRRQRRNATLARWAIQEPALAELTRLEDIAAERKVIPVAHFDAVLRITRTGDTLAARTLLQMIRPGLVRITRDLYSRHHPHLDAEVITAAWDCVHRVQHGIVRIHTASCLLRSIRRDVLRARLTPQDTDCLTDTAPSDSPQAEPRRRRPAPLTAVTPTTEPAEATAFAGPLARAALDDAVTQGAITRTAADLVWLTSVREQPLPTVAAATGTPTSTAYAIRAHAHTRLRDHYTAA